MQVKINILAGHPHINPLYCLINQPISALGKGEMVKEVGL